MLQHTYMKRRIVHLLQRLVATMCWRVPRKAAFVLYSRTKRCSCTQVILFLIPKACCWPVSCFNYHLKTSSLSIPSEFLQILAYKVGGFSFLLPTDTSEFTLATKNRSRDKITAAVSPLLLWWAQKNLGDRDLWFSWNSYSFDYRHISMYRPLCIHAFLHCSVTREYFYWQG